MDQQLFVTMALNGWNLQVIRAAKFFDGLDEKDFQKQIASGKNRIVYLYGHLTAYHDLLKETLGIGTRTYPELTQPFLKDADSTEVEYPSLADLKAYWEDVHGQLNELFAALPAEDWFKRHTAMTDEDFAQDPTRNRLSVVMSRTNHIAYHYGQLILA